MVLRSYLVGGIVEAIFGTYIIKRFWKYFPSVVTGIGIVLFGTGITYIAGGFGAANYGALPNYALGALTLIIVIIMQQFGKGIVKAAAGYIVAAIFGMIDFSTVADAAWLGFPQPLMYGLSFNLASIGIMLALYL
jgi:xanthine/uracil permease